jgi:hypothetical protein
MTERTLDRLPRWDENNLRFVLKRNDPQVGVAEPPARSVLRREVWLDQGKEGACVGYSAAQALAHRPHVHPEIDFPFAEWAYHQARMFDEWPGDNYSGSSVLGGAQGLKAGGYISSYFWAQTLTEIVHTLGVLKKPVVLGIDWYTGMMDPDEDNFVHVSGVVEGGHAIMLGGYEELGKQFYLYNSWGPEWGENGNARILAEDLKDLLSDGGDAVIYNKVNPLPELQSYSGKQS